MCRVIGSRSRRAASSGAVVAGMGGLLRFVLGPRRLRPCACIGAEVALCVKAGADRAAGGTVPDKGSLALKAVIRSPAPWWLWKADGRITTRSCRFDGCQHVGDVVADGCPLIRRKLDQCELPTGQVLLIPDVPVTGNPNGEPGLFGGPDKVAVLDGG